jgi:tRNA (mo5U34)-methyltransferase
MPAAAGVETLNSSSDELTDQFWWHSIRLDDGRVTPGIKALELMEREFHDTFSVLDLTGQSVLDVGAWNGGFSIEAKRRGADRVVAVDHFTWNNPTFRGRAGFDLATRLCNLTIEAADIDLDAPRLSLGQLGTFDIVLFLGVFYHLIDPIAALREVAAVAGKVLVVETYLEETLDPRPAMVFYPGSELVNDPTNWWGPNRNCMEALLRLNDFNRIDFTETQAIPSVIRPGETHVRRGVFHAYRT